MVNKESVAINELDLTKYQMISPNINNPFYGEVSVYKNNTSEQTIATGSSMTNSEEKIRETGKYCK